MALLSGLKYYFSKESLEALCGKISQHIKNKENPHSVTKAQLGLDKVENKVIPDVVQITGQLETDVMSQKAVTTALDNKVDKVEGQGLYPITGKTFTQEEKTKLEGLKNYDDTEIKNQKADKFKSYTAVIPASGWSDSAPYTQTVSVSGMIEDGLPLYDLKIFNATELEEFAKITKLTTAVNQITVVAQEDKPLADINLRIEVTF